MIYQVWPTVLPGIPFSTSYKFSSQAFFLSLSAFLTNGGAQGTPSLPVYSFSFFLYLSDVLQQDEQGLP